MARVWLCLMALAMAVPVQAQIIMGDTIPVPLADQGDPARGRALIVDRQKGFCLLCHTGPFPEQRFMGNLAPDLTGVGGRYTLAQLRLRIAIPRVILPDTIMPSYFVTDGLNHVALPFRGKPILTAQEIEDVVAFLATLKEGSR